MQISLVQTKLRVIQIGLDPLYQISSVQTKLGVVQFVLDPQYRFNQTTHKHTSNRT